ncbi:acyltransferase family protein [Methylobacillus pratensis]
MSSSILDIKHSTRSYTPSLVHSEYRPDIDGLRAISIFAVVFYHVFPMYISGGFVGVDVFFVISGFLISAIIINNLEKETFSFYDFYLRRIKRIFPALIIVLFSSLVFGWYVLFTDEYKQLGKHIAVSILFLSNIALWNEAGYFDSASESKPLLHLWSLGVEEQFYILWPLIIYIFWRFKTNLLIPIIALGVISFFLNTYYISDKPTAVFYLPISRFWELLAGALLAYHEVNKGKVNYIFHRKSFFDPHANKIKNVQSVVGISLLLFAIFTYDQNTKFPGWAALLPVFGTFLLISAGTNAWVNRALISNSGLIWIGLISYPLYLWHWPFLVFSKIIYPGFDDEILAKILVIFLSIIFAWFTYRYIEIRIRHSKHIRTISILVITMVGLFALGLSVYNSLIIPRVSDEWKKVSDARLDRNAPRGWQNNMLKPVVIGEQSIAPSILFFGDSHMEQYYPRIQANTIDKLGGVDSVMIATAGGCPPIKDVDRIDVKYSIGCPDFFNAGMKLALSSSVKKVILGAYWDGYFLGRPALDADPTLKVSRLYHTEDNIKTIIQINSNQYSRLFEKLETSISELKKKGKQVYIILPNPASELYDPEYYIRSYKRLSLTNSNPAFPKLSRDQVNQGLFEITTRLKVIANKTGAITLDPLDDICNFDICLTAINGSPINQDKDHLSSSYVKNHIRFIDKAFTDKLN